MMAHSPNATETDPRRVLEDAALHRAECEILLQKGGLVRGTLVRVEKGGVVLTHNEAGEFIGGEDVRIWLHHDGAAYGFNASVIRSGVPVPDRGYGGILLGFIDNWTEAKDQAVADGRRIELVPPSGQPVSISCAPARLVRLAVDGLSFTLPTDFKMVFVQQGAFQVRLVLPGEEPVLVQVQVQTVSPNEDFLLYDLSFEGIPDADSHRMAISRLAELV